MEGQKNMLETVIEPLRSLDWEDTDAVEAATVKALAMLTSQQRTLRGIQEAALVSCGERLHYQDA